MAMRVIQSFTRQLTLVVGDWRDEAACTTSYLSQSQYPVCILHPCRKQDGKHRLHRRNPTPLVLVMPRFDVETPDGLMDYRRRVRSGRRNGMAVESSKLNRRR